MDENLCYCSSEVVQAHHCHEDKLTQKDENGKKVKVSQGQMPWLLRTPQILRTMQHCIFLTETMRSSALYPSAAIQRKLSTKNKAIIKQVITGIIVASGPVFLGLSDRTRTIHLHSIGQPQDRPTP